jgi:hypothetical protein
MVDSVLRIDIEKEPPLSRWSRVKRYFSRSRDNRYRFRISQSPGHPNPSQWTKLGVLGVPGDKLDFLRHNFPSESDLELIGSAFAKTIFNEEIYTMYLQSLGKLAENQKLRLLLTFDQQVDERAANAPWECIFHYIRGSEREHFGLSQNLSVARFIPGPADTKPLPIDTLRVMAVASNPHKCAAPLDVDKEISLLSQIAERRQDAVAFEPLRNATWEDFEFDVPGFRPHVLIFTGHGSISEGTPHLLFQTEGGDCRPIPVTAFANFLRPLRDTLQIVILSACETAVVEGNDPFSSAAAEIINAGIPVVVAMQSKVEETAAREFGLRFFNYLLQRHPIDTCVNAGRLAILEDERDHQRIGKTQWAVPVLYLSTRSEEIFDFKPTSSVNPAIEKHRAIQKAKFPRKVRPFTDRPALEEELKRKYAEPGVTLIYGPFGAGKTQLITSFCSSLIESPEEESGPLFFYINCSERFDTFGSVLTELDRQGKTFNFDRFGSILGQAHSTVLAELEDAQTEGVEGITQVLSRPHPEDDLENIKRFLDLLAQHHLVIVFDDYVWNRPDFWRELLEQLVVYLQVSKVFVITSSNNYEGQGDYSTIPVNGFELLEAEAFLRLDNRFDETTIGKVMEVAASVEYLPWYLKVIRDLFKGEGVALEQLSIETRAIEFIKEMDRTIDDRQRSVLKQLALLRRPITLRNLATMMNPEEPSEYWPAALASQGKSLLTFTRNLGVELPENLKRYYRQTMSLDERINYHNGAAEFYKGFAATPAK